MKKTKLSKVQIVFIAITFSLIGAIILLRFIANRESIIKPPHANIPKGTFDLTEKKDKKIDQYDKDIEEQYTGNDQKKVEAISLNYNKTVLPKIPKPADLPVEEQSEESVPIAPHKNTAHVKQEHLHSNRKKSPLEKRMYLTESTYVDTQTIKTHNIQEQEVKFNSFTRQEHTSVDTDMSNHIPSNLQIPTVINGDQKVKDGSTLHFRTAKEVNIGNKTISRNTLFSGQVEINYSGRLFIQVNSIKTNSGYIFQKLHCLDKDGINGIDLSKNEGYHELVSEIKEAGLDEVSSRVPVGGGIVSSIGRKIFNKSDQPMEIQLYDGYPVTFVPTNTQND